MTAERQPSSPAGNAADKRACKKFTYACKDYWRTVAAHFPTKSLTDEKAKKLTDEAVAIEQAEAKLKSTHAREVSVVHGFISPNDKGLALLTRSMLEILIDLASYIQVPAASVEERRTYPTPPRETAHGVTVAPLIQISTSQQAPSDAFAAVPYRNE